MWEDDITFCPVKDCNRTTCYRHQCKIRNPEQPHSYSVDIPKDCPKNKPGSIYDSPIDMQVGALKMAYTKNMESAIGDYVLKVCQKIGITISENDLIDALTADRERYKAAYNRGYEDGRKEHEKDISVLQDMLSRALEKAGEITRKEKET